MAKTKSIKQSGTTKKAAKAPKKSSPKGQPTKAKKSAAKPTARRLATSGKSSTKSKADQLPKAGSTSQPAVYGQRTIREVQRAPAIAQRSLSSGKPKKNQAGLLTKELEHYRNLLLAKRGELLGDMSSMEREALRTASGTNLSNLPIHMADMGTDNYEQEFTLGLVEKDRVLLREINQALAKIQDGTYGLCEGTGKPIGKARLEARPWARYSIEYARKIEMGLVRPTQ